VPAKNAKTIELKFFAPLACFAGKKKLCTENLGSKKEKRHLVQMTFPSVPHIAA